MTLCLSLASNKIEFLCRWEMKAKGYSIFTITLDDLKD